MIKILSYFFGIVFILSCSTSNRVVSDKLFQKRKYTNGWHINSSSRISSTDKENKKKLEASQNKLLLEDSAITFSDISTSEIIEKINKKIEQLPIQKNTQNTVSKAKRISVKKEDKQLVNSYFKSSHLVIVSSNTQQEEAPLSKPDVSDKYALFAILGVLVLFFTGIAPLAIWIAIGKGRAFRISLILTLVTLALLISFVISLAVFLPVAVFTPGIVSGITVVVFGVMFALMAISTFIHALYSIIRGY